MFDSFILFSTQTYFILLWLPWRRRCQHSAGRVPGSRGGGSGVHHFEFSLCCFVRARRRPELLLAIMSIRRFKFPVWSLLCVSVSLYWIIHYGCDEIKTWQCFSSGLNLSCGEKNSWQSQTTQQHPPSATLCHRRKSRTAPSTHSSRQTPIIHITVHTLWILVLLRQ